MQKLHVFFEPRARTADEQMQPDRPAFPPGQVPIERLGYQKTGFFTAQHRLTARVCSPEPARFKALPQAQSRPVKHYPEVSRGDV